MNPTTEEKIIHRRYDFIWNQIVELRKELVEHQKIRSNINTLKITSTSAALAILLALANADMMLPGIILSIPAFVGIFLDFRMKSYTISIKRTGHYIRKYLEPKIKEHINWYYNDPLWEEFMKTSEANPNLDSVSKFGFTLILFFGSLIGMVALDINRAGKSDNTNSLEWWLYFLIVFLTYGTLIYYLRKDYKNLNSECQFIAENK